MRSNDLEDLIIDKLDNYFNGAVKDYVIKESTDTPFLQLVIEMTLYNYYVVRVAVEKNTIFFSIVQSGFQLPLFKAPLSENELETSPVELDREIRLRIPDKYLQAKGWQMV
ncbi:hypothetical protein [Marinimicrobium agarilyticum]|uniref:hypothetical protein n=1 Tax=Marinimicrobium agarilyticum TaxID=306546 RepID=UPI000686CB89|nr:hypothetical protein [Marinimicrobium agarilyticum]